MIGPMEASTYDRLNTDDFFFNPTKIFVHYFIVATNNTIWSHLTQFSRAILHVINYTFPSPEVLGHQGEYPIPQNKLKQGEGIRETTNEFLGCLLDGSKFTIHLMPDKCQEISKLIIFVAK